MVQTNEDNLAAKQKLVDVQATLNSFINESVVVSGKPGSMAENFEFTLLNATLSEDGLVIINGTRKVSEDGDNFLQNNQVVFFVDPANVNLENKEQFVISTDSVKLSFSHHFEEIKKKASSANLDDGIDLTSLPSSDDLLFGDEYELSVPMTALEPSIDDLEDREPSLDNFEPSLDPDDWNLVDLEEEEDQADYYSRIKKNTVKGIFSDPEAFISDALNSDVPEIKLVDRIYNDANSMPISEVFKHFIQRGDFDHIKALHSALASVFHVVVSQESSRLTPDLAKQLLVILRESLDKKTLLLAAKFLLTDKSTERKPAILELINKRLKKDNLDL